MQMNITNHKSQISNSHITNHKLPSRVPAHRKPLHEERKKLSDDLPDSYCGPSIVRAARTEGLQAISLCHL
jgi:hypothetical protein